MGESPARERRSFRGSDLLNEEVVGVVAVAGERLALCAALGRGVVEGEVTGEDTRRGFLLRMIGLIILRREGREF